jgi:7,8-dihydropterin-6-yl-methyl-4-(beta-D-ribofuranosyl)aminobenzene 5'-phosphate synthase
LLEADSLELTVLVDNYTDILMTESTQTVRRPMFPPPRVPYAEHGLASILKVRSGSEEHVVMMDAGVTPECLTHNAQVLGADLSKTEAIVLSHGHIDHYGGMTGLLSHVRKGTPLVVHPDAFLPRRINFPMVGPSPVWKLDEDLLAGLGAKVVKKVEPSTVASRLVQVSGEVRRRTAFEKGFPFAESLTADGWKVDQFRDDQAVAVNLRGKGLVVLSGCAHAGIINTVEHMKELTGVQKVHAVLGGFHLTGQLFEPIIPATVEAMSRIAPDHVVPMHCTGWKAINAFASAMPEKFRLNAVGTTYVF